MLINNHFKRLFLLAVVLVIAIVAFYFLSMNFADKPELTGSLTSKTISLNGLERSYQVYTPINLSPSAPLIMVLHGSKGDGDIARSQYSYRFDALADKHGFIVVYPNGFEKHWNDCRVTAPYTANTQNVDDVNFLLHLKNHLISEYHLDAKQTFITGMSNGGQMVLRLAFERPNGFAVYAPVIASMPAASNMGCKLQQQPVSIAFMNGSADPLNPYNGGQVGLYGKFSLRGEVLSTNDSVAYWTELANLTDSTTTKIPNKAQQDHSTISLTRWSQVNHKTVALYSVIDGGHSVPSSSARVPRILGNTNQDADAANLIWQFFIQANENTTVN